MSNQTAAAIAAMTNAINWERSGLDHQAIIEAGNKGLLGKPLTDWLLTKSWLVVDAPQTSLPQPKPIPDDIIHMDRSVALTYPDWVKEPLYPEKEKQCPAEINIATNCIQWLHDAQKGGKWTKGHIIHDYLVANHLIDSCYGLYELLAIQGKGIVFFRKHFKGKAVVGWKGTVRSRDGNLRVPCLFENGGRVVLHWFWLDDNFHDDYPGLRFAS